ncbi:MAG: hypothetical protein QHH14_01085 [Clostridiales bacterium]|nr:hypothetical protein [Clostridiales bacterium]
MSGILRYFLETASKHFTCPSATGLNDKRFFVEGCLRANSEFVTVLGDKLSGYLYLCLGRASFPQVVRINVAEIISHRPNNCWFLGNGADPESKEPPGSPIMSDRKKINKEKKIPSQGRPGDNNQSQVKDMMDPISDPNWAVYHGREGNWPALIPCIDYGNDAIFVRGATRQIDAVFRKCTHS